MSKKDNIVKFPIKTSQLRKNKRGKMSVDCIVSDRWLKFSDNSTKLDSRDEVFFIDVMTTNVDGIDRKICQLIIQKDELINVISRIKCTE